MDTGGQFSSGLRGGALGLVAAMAMTGMRTMSTSLGLLERTPPEEVVTEEAPRLLGAVPPGRRRAVIELAHWAFGTGAGAVFGALPSRVRHHRAAGPAYGVAIWLSFATVMAPSLGLRVANRRPLSSNLMLLADHLLYGVIVGGRLPTVAGVSRPVQHRATK